MIEDFSRRRGRPVVRDKVGFGTAFALAIVLVTMASPAYAYIDPGSASIFLQAVVGGLAAGAFALKMYWQRVRRFFGLKSKDPEKRSDRAGG